MLKFYDSILFYFKRAAVLLESCVFITVPGIRHGDRMKAMSLGSSSSFLSWTKSYLHQ